MSILKAHGTGNDFVVLIDLDDRVEMASAAVEALCDRRTGIGADGVIRIGGPIDGGDVFMDYRNADGSVVEMCGNGVRVVAKVVNDLAVLPGVNKRDRLEIDTRAGRRPVTMTRDPEGLVTMVTVDMGPPSFGLDDGTAASPDGLQLAAAPGRVWHTVSMGNPHAITRVDDVSAAPVTTLGPIIETDPSFPDRTNVEFAAVVDRHTIDLRVWERGVGETQACGTGACAVAAFFQESGDVDGEVDIRLPGGTLRITRPGPSTSVFMTGPAEIVAQLDLDVGWLARRGVSL